MAWYSKVNLKSAAAAANVEGYWWGGEESAGKMASESCGLHRSAGTRSTRHAPFSTRGHARINGREILRHHWSAYEKSQTVVRVSLSSTPLPAANQACSLVDELPKN